MMEMLLHSGNGGRVDRGSLDMVGCESRITSVCTVIYFWLLVDLDQILMVIEHPENDIITPRN